MFALRSSLAAMALATLFSEASAFAAGMHIVHCRICGSVGGFMKWIRVASARLTGGPSIPRRVHSSQGGACVPEERRFISP